MQSKNIYLPLLMPTLVTGLHSMVTWSTYCVSHTVSCSVQHDGVDTGAGAATAAADHQGCQM